MAEPLNSHPDGVRDGVSGAFFLALPFSFHFITFISFHFIIIIIIHDETRKMGLAPGSRPLRRPSPPATGDRRLARLFPGRFPERLLDRSGPSFGVKTPKPLLNVVDFDAPMVS